MDLSKITYCELDLPYDKELFIKEIDEVLIPKSMQINAIDTLGVQTFAPINKAWGMVSDDDYVKPKSEKAWYVNSLIYSTSDSKYLDMLSHAGSIVTRNKLLDTGEWKWKPEYEHLELTKFIKSLPLTDIIHARTLCLYPGNMAAIHRDDRTESLTKSLLADAGYVTITLNVSDGGQPLYFSLLEDEEKCYTVNEPIYVFNDFNLHGVPYVTGVRRQVRISGRPTEKLFDLLKIETLKT